MLHHKCYYKKAISSRFIVQRVGSLKHSRGGSAALFLVYYSGVNPTMFKVIVPINNVEWSLITLLIKQVLWVEGSNI